LVAQALKDANDIAQIAMRKHRVVTMDGDVVNPKGSMSGGAKKKRKHSLFTREKDLQDITEKLTAYKVEANAIKKHTTHKKKERYIGDRREGFARQNGKAIRLQSGGKRN